MDSKYRLNADLDINRKITDLRTEYKVTMIPPTDLSDSFYDYSEGFFSAAHYIAVSLLETDHPDISKLDSYFFSLAFLYRHSLELILKALAFRNICDKGMRILFAKNTFHDLAKILEGVLNVEPFSRNAEELCWLQKYLADASRIDKESDAFRYPFHIRKQDALFGGGYNIKRVFEYRTHIDLVSFANNAELSYRVLKDWYRNEQDLSIDFELLELKPVFIEAGGYYYGSSVVGYGYKRQDFYPYIDAYVDCAGLLRTKMSELYDNKQIDQAANLFMPMCYLYRNAVEIAIKSAWFEDTRESFKNKCKILNKKKHSIYGLWNALYKWIKDFYPEDNGNSVLEEISLICNELQGFDGTASKFRYPCSKDMELFFRKEKVFDFINVAEYMEGLINAIDGVGMELSVRNEYYDEMEAEMLAEARAEMASCLY